MTDFFASIVFDPQFCGRLCLTLAHSLWQFALLAVVAAMMCRLRKNDDPEWNHAASVAALVVGLVALPVTFVIVDARAPQVAMNERPIAEIQSAIASPLAPPMIERLPESTSPLAVQGETPQEAAVPPSPEPTALVQARLLHLAPWLVGGYAIGVLVMFLRLGRGIWISQRLVRRATPITAGLHYQALQRLARSWSLRVVPALVEVRGIVVPQVVGLLKPTILLPTSALTGLTPDELEMILAHELAHVRRYDMWVSLVQRLAETVLFFNPGLWYLSRRVSTYREYCCDEQTCHAVNAESSTTRLRYAQALLRVVELASGTGQCQRTAALAATGSRPSELRRRVARLFGEPLREPVRISRTGLVMLGIGLAFLLVGPVTWQTAAEPVQEATSPQAANETESKPTVEVVAIGTHDEEPQRWWDAEGKLLGSVPFTWTAKARVTAPNKKWRRVVYRVTNLPPDAILSWDLTGVGASGTGELDFGKNPAEGKYFTQFFALNENQKTFGLLQVGIATGAWETITEADTQGASAVGLPEGKGIVFSKAIATAEGTVVVVSRTNINQHSRVVAIDKQGQLHTSHSGGGAGAAGITQTSPTFPGLKPEDIDHFEFQTRDYEWTEIKDLPVEPEPNNVTNSSSSSTPSTTDADRVVAAARAKTFGLHHDPRVLFQQTYRQAELDTMQGVEDGSLAALWQARDKKVDDAQLERVRHGVTLAWDGSQLLIKTDSPSRPGETYIQSRFWDGKEGWWGEVAAGNRHVYRYKELGKLTEHVMPFYFPQWVAAGGRLPWGGPAVVLREDEVAPADTRYRLARTEMIDGISCDVYEGPERQETIWIDPSNGLVKAVSRHYVFDSSEEKQWKTIQTAADREFADQQAFMEWYKALDPVELLRFSARWAVATWPLATPGNLSVFSDYREIVPGVHWPMRVERMHVRPQDRDGKKQYYFSRAEITVDEAKTDFDIQQLATDALPAEGVEVTDRRGEMPVDYVWSLEVDEDHVAELQDKQFAERQAKEEAERQINEAPIESVADAIEILVEGPKTDPTMIWARAIKYLVDHKQEALPALIKQLDSEERDHPISKLAFALRAIGDPKAVPALIRALPRTLQPSRSDYGLLLKDRELCRFMQQHDLIRKERSATDTFDYGRAFREVAGTLQRLTGQNLGEMELNWVRLAETESQRVQQRRLFHKVAERWATWWEENWSNYVDQPEYAKVNLQKLKEEQSSYTGRQQLPAGPSVKLAEGHDQWIVSSVHESTKRCFVDLDTGREMDWPESLPAVSEIGLDSPELLAWVRKEGIDLVGVSHTPEGENEPLYCLHPFDMHVWKISEDEHRTLAKSMTGESPYPLSKPVKLMVPRREVSRPYDYKISGDSFLFVTREGTAGVVRMTAQVTEARDITGYASSRDDMFSPVGFYRGAKISFAAVTEP